MKKNSAKLLISAGVLVVYLGVTAFGLSQFGHYTGMSMEKCPYTQNNYALCDNSFEHINSWQQLSNVVIGALFVLPILIFATFLVLLSSVQILSYRWRRYLSSNRLYSYFYKKIRWLSLFESSPPYCTKESF